MLASVALPAFFPHSLLTLVGLLFIAAIEGWFLKHAISISYRVAYWHAIAANLKSTFVGIPIAWSCWLAGLLPASLIGSAAGIKVHPLIGQTLGQTALSGGFIATEWSGVAGALAWIVLLVPFWFGSVWTECKVLRQRLPEANADVLLSAVRKGNAVTYSIFLALGIVVLLGTLERLPKVQEHYRRVQTERARERASLGQDPQSR